MSTVWDIPPELPTPKHDPVDGKLLNQEDRRTGVSLGVFADLAFSIGSLAQRVDKAVGAYERSLRAIPGDPQLAATGIYPSSGDLLLDLGSPALGTFWQVRRLIVGGNDITTAPAGTAWVFVMGMPPNANGGNPNLAQAADFTTETFPQRAFYGTHELVVNPPEHLYVIITSGTANTEYGVSAKIESFDTHANFIE